MHELGITRDIVETFHQTTEGACVTRVMLEIGCLCGVQPDAIRFCFEVCAAGTSLAGSALEIRLVPALGTCRDCGQEMSVRDWLDLCSCGSDNLALAGGDRMQIRAVEIG